MSLGPPHLYTKVASTAWKIFDYRDKKSFATKSALKRPSAPPPEGPLTAVLRTRFAHGELVSP